LNNIQNYFYNNFVLTYNYSILAVKKNSACVIEKCIEKAPQEVLKLFIDRLVDGPDSIKPIVESNYGLYVIQKLLEYFHDTGYDKAILLRENTK
jgi:hypothetical protein